MLESGNLKHFKLADLINILGQSQKTGELIISSRDHHGTLYFSNGTLIHASNGPLAGEEIVYELMSCESGEFSFVEKAIDVPASIQKTTEELIHEGSLRTEIVNRLSKNSISNDPNSIVHLIKNDVSDRSEDEKILINILNNSGNVSIIKLIEQSNLSSNLFVNLLNNLLKDGFIEIKKSEEESFFEAFQQVVSTFYSEFTSISGTKMSVDLDKKIQDLIVINTWNLSFKDGRIYSNELFNFPVEEQWKIYKVFLDELLTYFGKVYGDSFIDKVFNNISETNSGLKILLNKLNR